LRIVILSPAVMPRKRGGRFLTLALDSSANSSSSNATSHFVESGMALLVNSIDDSWIIDSGANKHMTGSIEKFLDY
jgi:hypothetical protein